MTWLVIFFVFGVLFMIGWIVSIDPVAVMVFGILDVICTIGFILILFTHTQETSKEKEKATASCVTACHPYQQKIINDKCYCTQKNGDLRLVK